MVEDIVSQPYRVVKHDPTEALSVPQKHLAYGNAAAMVSMDQFMSASVRGAARVTELSVVLYIWKYQQLFVPRIFSGGTVFCGLTKSRGHGNGRGLAKSFFLWYTVSKTDER